MTDEQPAEVARVVGRRVRISGRRLTLMGLATIALIAVVLWQPEYFVLLYAAFPAASVIRGIRPPSEVTAAGISRPWHRQSRIDWSEIASIAAPEPGRFGSRLEPHRR